MVPKKETPTPLTFYGIWSQLWLIIGTEGDVVALAPSVEPLTVYRCQSEPLRQWKGNITGGTEASDKTPSERLGELGPAAGKYGKAPKHRGLVDVR